MIEQKPKFSVLMANFNKGRFIKQSIESVLAQTYSNWELVIVDDASTDNSIGLIKPFLSDNRIKLFRHKINLGCGQTKKDCAENAKGEILGILDSDDALNKRTLEIFNDIYREQGRYGAIYSTYYECDEQLRVLRHSPWVRAVDKSRTNLKKSYTSHFLTFKKSEYLKTEGFSAQQKKAVDKDIIYKLEEVTDYFFIPQPLYYYRMHSNGISLGKNEQAASAYAILAKYKAYIRRRNTKIQNFSKKEISELLLKGSYKFFISSDYINSLKLLLLSVKINPINFLIALIRFLKKNIYKNVIPKLINDKIARLKKHKHELNYWRERKNNESILTNNHFEYFYTELFGIDKSFYTGKKILDIGCGPRGSLEWAENAYERVGLDPLANKYKSLGIDKHKMTYVDSGSENIPYADQYFDAVFSFNSLDHVDNLDKTIEEIIRVLKPRGIFLLITEFNHSPTVCEPQAFSDNITEKFKAKFTTTVKRKFIKAGGIYESIIAGNKYDGQTRLPGVLLVNFIKK